ncbi:MAG: DUF512 domain-containing protein [Eubacterium sp.]|nr:DUF512 domain-containing protein [Eubacterium sp.]
MSKKEHKIFSIEKGSIAEELGLEPGDILLTINGQAMEDIFDYHFLCSDENLSLLVRKTCGEEQECFIEKDYSEDLGIGFENGLMDEYRSCRNKCIFCFIDQMPPNMRETLYFKDDDSRLSFLQGNYITLTNLSDEDVDRIVRYHLAPINVSVHTTNPELRCKMLNNRFAGDALNKIQKFYDAGIEMNGQIVLCKGINDGVELEKSIRDLMQYLPYFQSLSVVPVGLTKYREGLYPLEPFTREDAIQVLDIIHKYQMQCKAEHGINFVHAGDEWYLLAEQEFPPEERYDDYVQLENGVGMMRLLQEEFMACDAERREMAENHKLGFRAFLKSQKLQKQQKRAMQTDFMAMEAAPMRAPAREVEKKLTIATGKLAAPLMRKLSAMFMTIHPETEIQVIPIHNDFFGERITVSGLITGQDLALQLAGIDLGDKLLLPCNMMRSGERIFLDDVTVEELEKTLQVPIHIVKSDGQSLYEALLDR